MRKINTKNKRKIRNRKKLKMVSQNKLRVSVYKSLKNISAQIIDDNLKKTIVSASSVEKALKKDKIKKIDLSNTIGELLAKRAKEKRKLLLMQFRSLCYRYKAIRLFVA